MNTRILNISFAIFWLTLLVGFMTREWWMPPPLLAMADTEHTPLILGILAVMAMWNVSRFWFSLKSGPPKSQITDELRQKIRGITGTDPKVTDPQFNFGDADKPAPN